MKLEIPSWIILMNQIYQKEGKSISKIRKDITTNYPHSCNLIHKFKEEGLVTLNKEGREQLIHLTDKGRKLAEICFNLIQIK